MPKLLLAAVSLNTTPLDWEGNRRIVREALSQLRNAEAAFACFPELCLTGYGAEDAFLWPETAARALESLAALLPETRGLCVSFGLPLWVERELFNVAALCVDGELIGFAAKQNLAREGIHYEPRWFTPWPRGKVTRIQVLGKEVPVGDLLFDVVGVRVGFEICEDAWVDGRPGRDLARRGADLLFNPSASHFAFGKHERRRALIETAARELGVGYLYANLVGNEAGRAIYDGDCMVASGGEITALARHFSLKDLSVTFAPFDLMTQRAFAEKRWGARKVETEVNVAFPLPEAREVHPGESRVSVPFSREEAFARAGALALFDYLRKSRSRGFVVSLSGGADSTAVAVLVRLMVAIAAEELGLSSAYRRLGLDGQCPSTESELMSRLLWTAYQSTENSGALTKRAAREVAEAVSSTHFEFDVEPIAEAYRAMASGALGRALSWESDDLALQNIQARTRAPSVWMLANLTGGLLLSTSNRSEAAVGYATMDGDTAGGLAPLAGIDKAFLRRWLVFMEEVGLREIGSIPALAVVNRQAPTAELRPSERVQTDEADLMPYEVLDRIERLLVLERVFVRDIPGRLEEEFPAYEAAALRAWTIRFLELFARSQWKRERFAPSFHFDDENLDSRSWLRFPILSGGFASDIEALRKLSSESR